jgi:hypothetical protein
VNNAGGLGCDDGMVIDLSGLKICIGELIIPVGDKGVKWIMLRIRLTCDSCRNNIDYRCRED